RMTAYGDRVQFDLPGKGKRPNYQVINAAGKKMAFDSKNFVMRPNENGDVSDNLSAIFTLDQIRAAKALRSAKPARARSARVASTSPGTRPVAAPKVVDTVDADKYKYFRENRDALPEGIQQHSESISSLM